MPLQKKKKKMLSDIFAIQRSSTNQQQQRHINNISVSMERCFIKIVTSSFLDLNSTEYIHFED